MSDPRPPRYGVWTAFKGMHSRGDVEYGYFAAPRRGLNPPGSGPFIGNIRWGPRGRRLAERDCCKLFKKARRHAIRNTRVGS